VQGNGTTSIIVLSQGKALTHDGLPIQFLKKQYAISISILKAFLIMIHAKKIHKLLIKD
jgi:hypothetical protein